MTSLTPLQLNRFSAAQTPSAQRAVSFGAVSRPGAIQPLRRDTVKFSHNSTHASAEPKPIKRPWIKPALFWGGITLAVVGAAVGLATLGLASPIAIAMMAVGAVAAIGSLLLRGGILPTVTRLTGWFYAKSLNKLQGHLEQWKARAVPTEYREMFPKFEVMPMSMFKRYRVLAAYDFANNKLYVSSLGLSAKCPLPLDQTAAHEGTHALTNFRAQHLKARDFAAFTAAVRDAVLDGALAGDSTNRLFGGFKTGALERAYPAEMQKEIKPQMLTPEEAQALKSWSKQLEALTTNRPDLFRDDRLTDKGVQKVIAAMPETMRQYYQNQVGSDWQSSIGKLIEVENAFNKQKEPFFITKPYLPQPLRQPVRQLLETFADDRPRFLVSNMVGTLKLTPEGKAQIRRLVENDAIADQYQQQFSSPAGAQAAMEAYLLAMSTRLFTVEKIAVLTTNNELETKLKAIPLTPDMKHESIVATKRMVLAPEGTDATLIREPSTENQLDAAETYYLTAGDERLARKMQYEFAAHNLGADSKASPEALAQARAGSEFMNHLETFIALRKSIDVAPQDIEQRRGGKYLYQLPKRIDNPEAVLAKTPDNKTLLDRYKTVLQALGDTLSKCADQLRYDMSMLKKVYIDREPSYL